MMVTFGIAMYRWLAVGFVKKRESISVQTSIRIVLKMQTAKPLMSGLIGHGIFIGYQVEILVMKVDMTNLILMKMLLKQHWNIV